MHTAGQKGFHSSAEQSRMEIITQQEQQSERRQSSHGSSTSQRFENGDHKGLVICLEAIILSASCHSMPGKM